MKIYLNKKTNSILAAKLKQKKISTISPFFDSFFDSFSSGHYGFFDNDARGIKSADEKEIIFYSPSEDDFGNVPRSKIEEVFTYIGEASNYEELLKIL